MVKEGYKEVRIGPIKYEIPVNWQVRQLGNISKVKRGASPRPISSDKWFNENSGIGWVRISDITSAGKYLKETQQYLSKEGIKKSRKANKGEIILSICATVGKPSILDIDTCIHDGLVLFRDHEENILNEFLYYVLLRNQQILKSKGQTGTQANLNTSIVKRTRILLPPIPEQKKISSILSLVDKSIEKTDEVIEETKELKKGLMQELLTKGIGHSEFKKVRVGTKLIKIPKEWDLLQFNKIYKKRNKRNKDDQNYRYIGLEHIESGNINLTGYDNNGQERSSSRMFETGDILYGKLRPYLDKAAISRFDGICSTDIIPIYSSDLSTNEYLLYLLHSKFFIDFAVSTMEGTNLPRTSWRVIKNLNIPIPQIKEQKKIASILSSVDAKIKKEKEYKDKLDRLKKGLMQKLLTGEIRVNTDMEV